MSAYPLSNMLAQRSGLAPSLAMRAQLPPQTAMQNLPQSAVPTGPISNAIMAQRFMMPPGGPGMPGVGPGTMPQSPLHWGGMPPVSGGVPPGAAPIAQPPMMPPRMVQPAPPVQPMQNILAQRAGMQPRMAY